MVCSNLIFLWKENSRSKIASDFFSWRNTKHRNFKGPPEISPRILFSEKIRSLSLFFRKYNDNYIENYNWKLQLKITIENYYWKLELKIRIENYNWKLELKITIENYNWKLQFKIIKIQNKLKFSTWKL